MTRKILIITLILTSLISSLKAQQATYTVKKAPFSSDSYDEYSPVFYKGGIVFSSNRGSGSFVDYTSSAGKATFNINFIDTTKKVTPGKTILFSKSLNTPYNEGPVTFSRNGDTIYFCRNLKVEGKLAELSNPANTLGIFSAVKGIKDWGNIREFRFNNEYYNITTPYLTSDGLKLFFASDRPGGYGGSDIYYCILNNGYWQDPVNLGPMINTKGNESYPYINGEGEFFFSSDGHSGLGGKDIFVTKQTGSGWLKPIRLDEPINSKFDDFGIVTDALMNEGYFSSNREKTIDIYHFKTNFFSYLFCEPQIENQYCRLVSDTGSVTADTLRFQYVWDFGDNSKSFGKNATHCFPGLGNYTINLDIIDRRTGKLFFRKMIYNIDVINIEQPYISSQDAALTSEAVEFDGLKSYCPGYTITGYFWDFGDGTNGRGEKVSHEFLKSGEYNVRIGLTLKSQVTGYIVKRTVSKNIRIFGSEQERTSFIIRAPKINKDISDISQAENIKVKTHYSAETEYKKGAVFQVVILSSSSRILLGSSVFKNVPEKYVVKEVFDSKSSLFLYIIDQQMNLMATYPAYNEMITLGYSNTIVRIFVLDNPAEKELYLIKSDYNLLTDVNFDANNILTTSAYIMLDQVVNLMNKYPNIKLEIGVHTDNQGVSINNLSLSQMRAQIIVNYMVNRGISGKRLSAKGYSGDRPVASNIYATDRRQNRRIEFTILL
jgi:outer membrane protein OmpA-like peptidoglycan-associated protein